MNFYLRTFLVVFLISTVVCGVHHFVVDHQAISIIKIYTFLGTATFITVSALKFVFELVPDKLGYAFLALVFIKFGAIFLTFPELLSENPKLSKLDLLSFLAPYFIFLFIEVAIVIKWLNKN